ncbi:unnamed protein product [Dibothriocephalus latus]|uniref:Uncharacterized protein n=1 Tax=Dibothriocephalus latus TaxID=60516 RepID=A0A3P7NNX2_DIBLA|nr:unnamed protein product [Dibothriocephalus latus]
MRHLYLCVYLLDDSFTVDFDDIHHEPQQAEETQRLWLNYSESRLAGSAPLCHHAHAGAYALGPEGPRQKDHALPYIKNISEATDRIAAGPGFGISRSPKDTIRSRVIKNPAESQ